MARIMADLYIAEAATVGLSGFEKDSLQQVYYRQVFELHGLSIEEYERNLRQYADDVPRMETLHREAELLVNPAADSTGGK